MKKTINGKLYNTDTARLIGTYNSGVEDHLFGWYESLYAKRTGEFFIYGEGGPASKYAVHTSFERTVGSEKIFPLSYDEARAWAEKYLSEDTYKAEFGVADDDGTSVTLHLNLSAASADRARREAAKASLSVSAYVDSLIRAANKVFPPPVLR